MDATKSNIASSVCPTVLSVYELYFCFAFVVSSLRQLALAGFVSTSCYFRAFKMRIIYLQTKTLPALFARKVLQWKTSQNFCSIVYFFFLYSTITTIANFIQQTSVWLKLKKGEKFPQTKEQVEE